MESITGYICVLVAAVAWASSGVASKSLFNSGTTPFELVQVRVFLSALFLGALIGLFNRRLLRIRIADLGFFILLGGLVMSLVQFTYFYSISKIQVMAAVLLQYLAPIIVAIYSMTFWGERCTFVKVASLALAIAGCYLAAGGYDLDLLHANRLGIIGGLVSALCMATYSLLGERAMHRYSPWTVVFYALLFSAVAWHIVLPPFEFFQSPHSAADWVAMLWIVVIGTVAPFGLFFVGVNYIRSTRAMITATMEPISAGLLAFVFLGEALEVLQLLGAALVVGAIALLQIQREGEESSPQRVRSMRE